MSLRGISFGLLAVALPACSFGSGFENGGDFLPVAASSTADLVHEVQNDVAVKSRYLKHFGTTANQLTDYLWSLRPSHLAKATKVTVYSTTENGTSVAKRVLLPKNAAVFIDIHDKPVMLVDGGNPLTTKPQVVHTSAPFKLALEGTVSSENANVATDWSSNAPAQANLTAEELVHPAPLETAAPAEEFHEPMATSTPETASLTPVVPDTTSTTPPASTTTTPPETVVQITDVSDPTISDAYNAGNSEVAMEPGALAGNTGQYAPWLAGAGLLAFIATDQKSNSKSIALPPTPTPEPTTVILVGLGSCALLRRRKLALAK
jgi:hypothetical protein